MAHFREGYVKTVTSISISDDWMHIHYLSSFLQLQLLPLNLEWRTLLIICLNTATYRASDVNFFY